MINNDTDLTKEWIVKYSTLENCKRITEIGRQREL